MSQRRLLLWLRLLTGAAFMYQGVAHIQGMRAQADLFAASTAWHSTPGRAARNAALVSRGLATARTRMRLP